MIRTPSTTTNAWKAPNINHIINVLILINVLELDSEYNSGICSNASSDTSLSNAKARGSPDVNTRLYIVRLNVFKSGAPEKAL